MFQSCLHLSFLIRPPFKQPPYSSAEIEQLPIVCFTKQHFCSFVVCVCVCNHTCNHGYLTLGLLCFPPICGCPLFWWCVVGFLSAAIGGFRPVTPTIKTNLLINLIWLVLDRLTREWWTRAFSESSLTILFQAISHKTAKDKIMLSYTVYMNWCLTVNLCVYCFTNGFSYVEFI